MEPSRNIETLLEIMTALRDPDTGCPWDIEQDFRSIAPYTIEEACEVADAIEREDMDDLRLELGDLLLQAVYHAQMASEAGHFDFGDVVEGITRKMIRRHPHVFGTADKSAAEYSAEGLASGTWERIKSEEKAEQARERAAKGLPPKEKGQSMLDEVPATLPPLAAAVKLQKKASKVGFDWKDAKLVIAKIREETAEVEAELESTRETLTGEIGDLLFAVANLARHVGVDPDRALRGANSKFRRRFSHIEATLGDDLERADLKEMDGLWEEAKAKETGSEG